MKKKAVTQDEFIRKRIERQRRIRKRRIITFFCFLIIMMICVGITLSLTVFFPIENINAKGSNIYTAEEIIKHSGVNKGDNLFTVSRSDTEKNLKKVLPYVESVEFKRELPGTITIKVKDAEEFACYNVKGRYYTVSSSGWVLKETAEKPENLTEIVIPEAECKVGTQISLPDGSSAEMVERIVSALQSENLKLQKIDVTDTVSISLTVENRFTVNLGNSNNIEEKVKHLAGMIENIDAEKQGEINLSMWTSSNTKGTFVEKKD